MHIHVRSLMLAALGSVAPFVVGASGLVSLASVAEAQTKTVTLLDRGEPNDAMTFHAGHLWVGKSRRDFNANYSIEAYDGQDRLVASATLPHSATFLYPYNATSVLVFGTGYEPNLTQYTLVELRGTSLSTRTVQIPMQAWGNLWVGSIGSREYFTDMGGNQDDPARDADPNLASQTIFSMTGRTPRYLSTRMRMPIDGIVMGSQLYLLHQLAIGDGRSNLTVVNPSTGAATAVFSGYRNGLTKIRQVGTTPYVAASEMGAGQVVFVDSRNDQLVGTATDVGSPRALATLGHCVLAGDPWTNAVSVIDVSGLGTGATPTVIARLDLGLSSDEFRMLRSLAVDPSRGRIYARSNYACNPMIDRCDQDYNRVVALDSEAAGEVATQCR